MEAIAVISIVLLLWYWLSAMRAKEIATDAAQLSCRRYSLEFLDDTVALLRLRLRRNGKGQLQFYWEYCFEFSSTGNERYQGQVSLLGQVLLQVKLPPHRYIEESL